MKFKRWANVYEGISPKFKEAQTKPTMKHLPTHTIGKNEIFYATKMWGNGYSF